MNVLITGANGFIGRNITEHLSSRHRIYSPSRTQLNLLNSSEVDQFFSKRKIDIVIHCAVVGGSRTEEYKNDSFSQNLRMFFNVVKNAKRYRKIIHFGSGAEYNKQQSLVGVKESRFGKSVPLDDYGFYKYCCFQYLDKLDDAVNLRIFGVFGKYEDYRYRFISNAICRNISGLPITINQNVRFDYVYIDDLVRIVEIILNRKSFKGTYNIGTGRRIELLTIARKINELAIHKSRIIVKKNGLNNEYTCNNSHLMRSLGHFSFSNFDDSLRNLYNWYLENPDKYLKKDL